MRTLHRDMQRPADVLPCALHVQRAIAVVLVEVPAFYGSLEGGAEIALPRTNVKGSSSSGKSLMPEGVDSGMSVQDMADLLSFIEEQK